MSVAERSIIWRRGEIGDVAVDMLLTIIGVGRVEVASACAEAVIAPSAAQKAIGTITKRRALTFMFDIIRLK